MPVVTIDTTDFDTVTTVAEADDYLKADPQYAAAWSGYDDDEKARALVSARRQFDRLSFVSTVDLDAAPDDVKSASIILAAQVAAKPALSSGRSTAAEQKRVKGGSAEVEFFRKSRSRRGGRFSEDITALLQEHLESTRPVHGSEAFDSGGSPDDGGTGGLVS